MKQILTLVFLVFILVTSKDVESQITIGKSTKIGIGVGYRRSPDIRNKSNYTKAFISSIDSTLQLESIRYKDVTLSLVIASFPFHFENPKSQFLNRIGFTGSVKLIAMPQEIRLDQSFRSIEGGFGLAFKLTDDFAFSFGYELGQVKIIKAHYLAYEGKQISQYGKTLVKLDDSFFKTKYAEYWSFKLNYFF